MKWQTPNFITIKINIDVTFMCEELELCVIVENYIKVLHHWLRSLKDLVQIISGVTFK